MAAAKAEGVAVRGYVSCVVGCPIQVGGWVVAVVVVVCRCWGEAACAGLAGGCCCGAQARHMPCTARWPCCADARLNPPREQGEVRAQDAARVAAALYGMGCYEVSMGDTIGVGTPASGARAVLGSDAGCRRVGGLARGSGDPADAQGAALPRSERPTPLPLPSPSLSPSSSPRSRRHVPGVRGRGGAGGAAGGAHARHVRPAPACCPCCCPCRCHVAPLRCRCAAAALPLSAARVLGPWLHAPPARVCSCSRALHSLTPPLPTLPDNLL